MITTQQWEPVKDYLQIEIAKRSDTTLGNQTTYRNSRGSTVGTSTGPRR
jgi:hypothetical protein